MATYTLDYTKEQFEELHNLLIELGKTFRDVCEEEGIWYSLAFGTLLGAVREKNIIQWDSDIDVYIQFEDQDRLRKAFRRRNLNDVKYINKENEPNYLKSHDVLVFTRTTQFPDIHLDIYPIVGAPASKELQDKIAFKWNYLDRIIRSKYVNIRKSKRKFLVFFAKIIDAFIPDKVLKNNIHKRETMFNKSETGYWMTLVNYGPGRSCFPISFFDGYEYKELNGEKFKVLKEWDKYLKIVYGDYMIPKKY